MKRIMPPTYMWAFLFLTLVAHFTFPVRAVFSGPYTYLGVIFVLFGAVINIWADKLFKKHKTTVKPHEKPSVLLDYGPFSISRHPMYLGMFSVLLGVSFLCGTLVTFVFPLLFLIFMELLFIRMEELDMELVFGKKYLEYKKKTRRWL